MPGRIIITGGSGFIGSALSKLLHNNGYSVIVLSRSAQSVVNEIDSGLKYVLWDGKTGNGWAEYAENAVAIVNLAGENIGALWTKNKKRAILESRINAGAAVIDALRRVKNKPKVLVQASGIGYYGNSGEKVVDESAPAGQGFLPGIAKLWEESVAEAQSLGVRLVIARIGLVLGDGGGFMERVLLPFRMYAGGHFGSGRQWMSWIHLQDVVGTIQFLIENPKAAHIFNICSPNPVDGKTFFKTLGEIMHRPSYLPIPAFALKMMMGDMAEEMILSGQRARPGRLLDLEYPFLYTKLQDAFKNILN